MTNNIFQQVLDSGLEGALICLIIVVSAKLYRARVSSSTDSECCKKAFKFHLATSNSGGRLSECADVPAPDNENSIA
tara:strand:- start:401 stop:631 length:231 start_codon:yes stop_codon:yes gene_type:complete